MNHKGEKSLLSLIIKAVIILILVFLQILVFVFIFNTTKAFSLIASSLFVLVETILILYIMYKPINPAYKIIWIILILSVPVLGSILYLFLGLIKVPKRLRRTIEYFYKKTGKYIKPNFDVYGALKKESLTAHKQAKYLLNTANYPLYENDTVEYLSLGEIYYERMLEDIKNAEKFIFLEYFIVSKGKMWDELVKVLRKKAKEGVKIYISTDQFGSFFKIPKNFKSLDEEENIHINIFNPITPIISARLNYRDHRKITVIDGKVAYTGGINIGDEYINLDSRLGHWKDFGVRLTGNAVNSFTVMFIRIWNCGKKKIDITDEWFCDNKKSTGKGYILPYADGPGNTHNPAENTYMNIIQSAKDYVYITTPYLIIDNEVKQSLINASKSGVDVRIIIPHIPDKKLVYACSRSFYHELLLAGVKIYEYTPGFMHGKMCISDDRYATVGSINFDFRSLYLHYECGVWMYKTPAIKDMKKDFLQTMDASYKVSRKNWEKRSIFKKMLEAVLRLVAPLL